MLVSKFSAASAATFFVVPCVLAQTETRLLEVGVGASHAGAQDYTPLVASTGPKAAKPACKPAASALAMLNKIRRVQRALSLDDTIHYAFSPSMFDVFPLPPCAPGFFPIRIFNLME